MSVEKTSSRNRGKGIIGIIAILLGLLVLGYMLKKPLKLEGFYGIILSPFVSSEKFSEPYQIFADDFTAEKSQWDYSDKNFRRQSGALIPSGGKENLAVADRPVRDGRIQVRALLVNPSAKGTFGIFFRSRPGKEKYIFWINARGEYGVQSGNRILIAPREAEGLAGQNAYDLEVEFWGSKMTARVNHQELFTLYDPRGPEQGAETWGLFSRGETQAHFQEVKAFDLHKNNEKTFHGRVLKGNKAQNGLEVRLYEVTHPEDRKMALFDRVKTDGEGKYAFFVPENTLYLLEVTDKDGFSGGRIVDLNFPLEEKNLDILLEKGNRGGAK